MFGRSLVETTVAVKRYDLSLRPKTETASRLTPDGLRDNYFHNLERNTSRFDLLGSLTRSIPGLWATPLKVGGGSGAPFDGTDRGLPIEIVPTGARPPCRLPATRLSRVRTSRPAFVRDRFRLGPASASKRVSLTMTSRRRSPAAPRFAVPTPDDTGRPWCGRVGVFLTTCTSTRQLDSPAAGGNELRPDGTHRPRSSSRTGRGALSRRAAPPERGVDRQSAVRPRVGYRERYGQGGAGRGPPRRGRAGHSPAVVGRGVLPPRAGDVAGDPRQKSSSSPMRSPAPRETSTTSGLSIRIYDLRWSSRTRTRSSSSMCLIDCWSGERGRSRKTSDRAGTRVAVGLPAHCTDEEYLPLGPQPKWPVSEFFPSTSGSPRAGRSREEGRVGFKHSTWESFQPRDVVASLASPRFESS
jgi:hypothetical protein